MSSGDSVNSERPLNQAQVTRLFSELSRAQLTQFSEIIQTLMDRSQTEIAQLKDFSDKEIKRFIHEYERLDKPQQGLVKLRQRLNQKTYYHLESCGKLTSNETIIEFLRSMLYEEMVEKCNTAADLIIKNVKFDTSVKEHQAVEVMFREVRDLLARLPDGMEKKPKQIAKAILSLLPDYIWVREKDIFIRPELRTGSREELKKYVLASIPPPRMLERSKKLIKLEKKMRQVEAASDGEMVNAEVKAICDDPNKKTHPGITKQYSDKYLCEWCYRFGHHQSRCHRRDRPKAQKPTDDTLNQQWDVYIRRKKEERERRQMKMITGNPEADDASLITKKSSESQEEMDMEEEFFTNMKGVQDNDGSGDEGRIIFLSTIRPQKNDLIDFSQIIGDAEVRVTINDDRKQFFVALLDSGAFRSAINERLKKHCDEVTKLRVPLKVKAAGGSIYEVWEIGRIKKITVVLENSTYTFRDVNFMILNVEKWDDMILGNDVLKKHHLDPLSALRNLVKRKGGKQRISQLTEDEGCTRIAKWFEEVVGAEKLLTKDVDRVVITPELLEKEKEKVLSVSRISGDDELREHNQASLRVVCEKEDSEVIAGISENADEDWTEDEEETPFISLLTVDKFVKGANPVVFKEDGWEDDINLDEIDEGGNLDKSKEEDMRTMKREIKKKFESINLELFENSPIYKTKFEALFLRHCGAFGNSDSPTQLSILNPIECQLLPGKSVGVLKQHPLGYEQERFLIKRVRQMEQAGIICINDNPTTAMSVLVVPKKGPKKYRLVVDFRPLNAITTRVSNTLPLIDLQISRAKGKKLFSSYDLLSGFDYLPTKGESSEYFTFTTPWGVAYSFCGSPQG
eukprot:snap_masked-scaffold_13-processed-gene-3.31-mRNA-1 protein AED:1.00 eAED:1.00 QI:0/-1/0/0/-1/1/1/0/853